MGYRSKPRRYVVPVASVARGAYKAYQFGRSLKRAWNNYRTKGSKRRAVDAPSVTNQFDIKTQYRARRAPRRKVRRATRFAYRVNKIVSESQLGSKTVVRSFGGSRSWANNKQDISDYMLYSCDANSGADGYTNDLKKIFTSEFDAAYANKKLMFDGAVEELLLINSGENTIYLDVYTIVFRSDLSSQYYVNGTGTVNLSTVADFYNQAFENAQAVNLNPRIAEDEVLVTPFHNSEFCSIIKVLKKQRIILSGGQSTTMLRKDPKNRRCEYDNFSGLLGTQWWTSGWMIFGYGAPGDVGEGVIQPLAGGYDYYWKKTYTYRVNQDSSTETANI